MHQFIDCLRQHLMASVLTRYEELNKELTALENIIVDQVYDWHLLKPHSNVLAIKAYRKQHNCGLKEAYDVVVKGLK